MTMDQKVAELSGFTRHMFAEGGYYSLELLVKPDEDLDGTFRAYDVDSQGYINLNGWLWTLEDA